MSNYWWVRSGSATGDNFFDLVEERSLVGIGWPDVGDVRGLGFDTIRAKVRDFYPRHREGLLTNVLNNFANQIQIGDTVLTAKPHDRLVLIGQVTGEYEFNSNPEHGLLTHTRRVEWLRTDISYDAYNAAFEANSKNPPWGQSTVWNAIPDAGEITQLLAGITETDDDDPALGDDGSDADQGLRVGLESQLEDALKTNLYQLEPGLEFSRAQQRVEAGRLDIAATDRAGHIVVIELKRGTAQPDSMTQLLAYMGTIDNPEGKLVRGILVAYDFDDRVRYAARALPNVALRSYSFTFSFSDGGKDE